MLPNLTGREMRRSTPEIIDHKRGTTLRIPRQFPDSPANWVFTAAIQLPGGEVVPLTCTVSDPDAHMMGEVPEVDVCTIVLSLSADQSAKLPLDFLPCDYRAAYGEEVAASPTFYIHVLPEATK